MPAPRAANAVKTGWQLALWTAAWPVGAALQLREAVLQTSAMYAVGMAAAVGFALAAWCSHCRVNRYPWLANGAVALAIALCAFSATGLRATLHQADLLAVELEGRELQITGVVASLPQRTANGLWFRFEVEHATRDGQLVTLAGAVPAAVSLGWYAGFDVDAVLSPAQRELRAGQRWRFTVRLRQPHGLSNPHGFDQELRLFESGVGATGSVRDAPAPQLLDRAAAHPVERLRQQVRDAIESQVHDPRTAGVLTALAVGDQSSIERSDWDVFRRTGIAHLVSISGLHVTMFAWVAGVAIGAAWRRSARTTAWLPAPTAALWGGLAAAVAYAVFSGWGVPSQRTVWMLAAVTLLRSVGARWPWPLLLLSAATAVTAIDPWALLQPGFWLSFAAVGLLMVSGPLHTVRDNPIETPMSRPSDTHRDAAAMPSAIGWQARAAALRSAASGGVRTQLVATVGLAPLTLVCFQQVSLVGMAANLVAIPLITLVITPLALLGSVLPWLWAVGAWLVAALSAALGWLAAWPAAVWSVGAAPWWAQGSGLLAAGLLVMRLPWRVRALAIPLVLPLWMPPRDLPPHGQFELVAADIGQGTAVLVRTRHHLLVYDAGPQYSPDTDAGQRVLVPLLRSRGDQHIDMLVLSHRDSDHVGGAAALLRSGLSIGELRSSVEDVHPLLLQAQLRGVPTSRCVAGQQWLWDGVRFDVLHPADDDYAGVRRSNAKSCVLRIQAADAVAGKTSAGAADLTPRTASAPGRVALLTADIEREQEAQLLRGSAPLLRADVLMAPHHGSKTSSSPAFLDAVAPRVAVIQAGHHNRYGHPAAEVLARYRERGIALIDSPACGAWTWRSDAAVSNPAATARAATPIGECHRIAEHRYWHWRAPTASSAAAAEPLATPLP
jgi:competence protein ComEC